ncbi:hypothetical protein HPB47_016110 [Ixodes persulcatus]|uniref:Uncharacterized protein n=1 Tax=Ixodes persulcatus TaxID=34615 RepID=A0AC60QSY6_IXOPE|nr:hypothetical protein HPB47_016110 [Ixodes persulcatus]
MGRSGPAQDPDRCARAVVWVCLRVSRSERQRQEEDHIDQANGNRNGRGTLQQSLRLERSQVLPTISAGEMDGHGGKKERKKEERDQGLGVRDCAETKRQIFPWMVRPGGSETSTDRGDIEEKMISNAVETRRGFSETTRSAILYGYTRDIQQVLGRHASSIDVRDARWTLSRRSKHSMDIRAISGGYSDDSIDLGLTHDVRPDTQLSPTALFDTFRSIYIPPPSSHPVGPPLYTGNPKPQLDAPITFAELQAAVQALKRNTTPRHDDITSTLLRHPNQKVLEHLIQLFNQHWLNHTLPSTWKRSNITLIPKPGKTPSIHNLRPISLTSRLGKLLEHVLQNRVNAHLEHTQTYPRNMIGFRPNLSTQDALIQYHHDFHQHPPQRDHTSILSLDLQKAFDNISHHSILQAISSENLGLHFYHYIYTFLAQRTATIRLGHVQSDSFQMPDRGTPQGAVLSPMLFNLTPIPLARTLLTSPTLRSTLYADDIALWVHSGSDQHIEATLQHGLNRALHQIEL